MTLVTSNLPFDEWTEVFGSERLTGALRDRLTHHVHMPHASRLFGRRQRGTSIRREHSSALSNLSTTNSAPFTPILNPALTSGAR